jgi:hypothetical protein
MLKSILIFTKIALLLSQTHILNIEQGDHIASKYIDAIKPAVWENNGSFHKYTKSISATIKGSLELYKKEFTKLEEDRLPEISIFDTGDKSKQKYSYKVDKCDTCLLFNFIDQGKLDQNVKCTLTYPGIVFDTKENTDDQFKIDKVLTFDDFNIILKTGKVYFTQHDGDKFTKYGDISTSLVKLAGKVFIDVMSDEAGERTYILCHTEDEIFVFYIMKSTTGFSTALLHEVNKVEKGLKYNSISAFVPLIRL